MSNKKKLVVILGPTAIGKTAWSIALAKQYQTEIISADSRQFYHELNIGVARPSVEELHAVTHHFIDFISVEENFSAGMFERAALQKLEVLFSQNDTVILCGGSMMYVDALLYGLDDLPGDKNLKLELKKEFEEKGIEYLQKELNKCDPEYYLQVDINNPHRLMRAIEVCMISGKKYSELRTSQTMERPFEIIKIGLKSDREWMYERINKRVEEMIKNGLIEEVQSVMAFRHLNSLNTVGYKEIFAFLDGELAISTAVEKIKQHTRNFAKRQMTWWRQDPSIHWLDASTASLNSFVEIIESQA